MEERNFLIDSMRKKSEDEKLERKIRMKSMKGMKWLGQNNQRRGKVEKRLCTFEILTEAARM